MNWDQLRFYLIRLKKAPLAEWPRRVRERFFISLLRTAPSLFSRSVKPPKADPKLWESLRFPFIEGTADAPVLARILKGEVFCLGEGESGLCRFKDAWPRSFFSDIRLDPEGPDIREAWEPARLQHLTLVLHRIVENPDAPDAGSLKSFVRASLLTWIKDNPFLYGPNYVSVMECGLRIPVFLLGLKVLDTLSPTEQNIIFKALFEHAWITRKRLSLYSSLGNHTIAECVGLVFAGALFREIRQGSEWLRTGIRLLERECGRQILADGGPIERSLDYHGFVLDLYWFAVDFLEKNNLHDCSGLKERLRLGEKFRAAFLVDGQNVLRIGDSDDGHAVAPGLNPQKERPTAEPHPLEQGFSFNSFPETGYTVIRGPEGLFMTFNHGPLGMAPLYNHGHADALSITLYKGAAPFLVDPGTYTYNGKREHRAYFKGTQAHNTVAVDGGDQAEQLTGFVWDRPYRVSFSRRDQEDGSVVLEAAHDGYARLSESVFHTRRMVFRPGVCVVKDSFWGRGRHEFELHYHLHPDVRVEPRNGWLTLKNGAERIFLGLKKKEFSVIRGTREPFFGWFSPAYGVLQETTVLRAGLAGLTKDVCFTTVICTREPEAGPDFEGIADSYD
ncbi:MAG: alginate lyase family protein [Thermodesulfobacteriota bacterium]|nr:alginate lyase family protein [Thermodesulfobacteriota bacterium]